MRCMVQGQNISQYVEDPDKMTLYVHIPFCVSKCAYCDFCSFVPSHGDIAKYLQALYHEIDVRALEYSHQQITSIYIGGGTPSTLHNNAIYELLQHIRSRFAVLYNGSVTIEANPNSLTRAKAKEYFDAGIRRISIGLQSHSNRLLHLLNRPHSYRDFVHAVQYADEAGFVDISADILLGIPTQTMQDLRGTLDRLLDIPLTHISAYGLILEEGTPITNAINSGKLIPCSESLANKMYDYTVDRLHKSGFYRYEISNFCRSGYPSVHNLNYWNRGQYLGVGLGSHSFVNGVHWSNTLDFAKYLKSPQDCRENVEVETIETAKLETIMLALRTEAGLDIKKYDSTFGTSFLNEYRDTIKFLLNNNLITINNFRLTVNDFNVSNAIIEHFVR